MKHKLFRSAAVVAGLLMGSIGGEAMADEATTPTGVELPVYAYQSGNWAENAASDYPMVPFWGISYSESGGMWVDVGSPRKLSGVKYDGRSGFAERWQDFRVWGADVPGPYTSTEGMELVVSNYLGAASQTGGLASYEGIGAHRYYFFDNYGPIRGGLHSNGQMNFKVQLYSDDAVVRMTVPREDNAKEGNYVFSGKVKYAPTAAGVEVSVGVAKEDCGADYSAWAANGTIYRADGTFATGGAFEIVANGIASGRTYAKLFYRSAGDVTWFAAPGVYQFAARGAVATPRLYVWDKQNPTGASNSSQALYDGKYGSFGDNTGRAQQLIFKLDPSLDYAVLRVWARLDCGYSCWIRSHFIKGIYVAKPSEEPDWSGATQVEAITAREFYWIQAEADIPAMEWVKLPVATETMQHENQCAGASSSELDSTVDVILDKKLMSGAKYLKIELASNYMLNAREVALYTVEQLSFCIRIR